MFNQMVSIKWKRLLNVMLKIADKYEDKGRHTPLLSYASCITSNQPSRVACKFHTSFKTESNKLKRNLLICCIKMIEMCDIFNDRHLQCVTATMEKL